MHRHRNSVGVRPIPNPVVIPRPPASNLQDCVGEFELLPRSARTTSSSEGFSTTFVVQFTGSASCSTNPGYFGVDMTAADGTIVPIGTMPAGPYHPPLKIGPHQLVFGSIQWAVTPGLERPTHLRFTLGDTPTAHPISISVTDVSTPPHSASPTPQSPVQSTAYGLLTFAADPATLATLNPTMTAPSIVRVPSTLLYAVTLTNATNTAVPLTGCPQFVQQLSVVPFKTPVTVGSQGPLNCAHLPPAIAANSSVTMQMQLDTAGQVPGPGQLTWQLLGHDHPASTLTTQVTVQQN